MQNVHKCPCATVREIKQFTVHLLGDRLEKLKNSELRQLADKIIDAAIVEVNDGKEKRSNLRTSFISSRKDEIKRSVVRIVEKLSKNGGNLCDEEKTKLQGAYRIMLKGRPKKDISAKKRELPYEKESPSRNTSEEECSETEDICCEATISVAREEYEGKHFPNYIEQTHLPELLCQEEFSSPNTSDEQYSTAEDICCTPKIPVVPETSSQLDNLHRAEQQTRLTELPNQKEDPRPNIFKHLCGDTGESLCPEATTLVLKDIEGPLDIENRPVIEEEETHKSQKQKTQIDKLIKMRCYGFCGSKLPEIQMLNLECQKLEAQLNALQITLLKSRHVQRLQ